MTKFTPGTVEYEMYKLLCDIRDWEGESFTYNEEIVRVLAKAKGKND